MEDTLAIVQTVGALSGWGTVLYVILNQRHQERTTRVRAEQERLRKERRQAFLDLKRQVLQTQALYASESKLAARLGATLDQSPSTVRTVARDDVEKENGFRPRSDLTSESSTRRMLDEIEWQLEGRSKHPNAPKHQGAPQN